MCKKCNILMPISVVANISTRNINSIFFLKRGSYLVVRNESERMFIGEVLDLYKTASGNRYGSVISANSVAELKYLSVRVFLPLVTVSAYNLFYFKSTNIDWTMPSRTRMSTTMLMEVTMTMISKHRSSRVATLDG
jgi:hypothetical protein